MIWNNIPIWTTESGQVWSSGRLAGVTLGARSMEPSGSASRSDNEGDICISTESAPIRSRSAEGVVFDSSKLEPEVYESPVCKEAGIDCALISLASRPTLLDSSSCPKSLTVIAGKYLITLVMEQLRCGGINKIFLVIGAHGALIQKSLKDLHLLGVEVVFIDLGEEYDRGFANSLVAGCSFLERSSVERFLLCTADHLFDPALITQLRKVHVGETYDAVALVEANVGACKGLPTTAVRCAFASLPKSNRGLRTISYIAQEVLNADGIEAGLYAWSMKAKSSLAKLASRERYFTVAHAMQHLANSGRLGASLTNGKTWFAVETQTQLNSVPMRGDVPRFPWQARVLHSDDHTSRKSEAHAAPAAGSWGASSRSTKRSREKAAIP